MLRIEGVLHLDRNIPDANGIYCWRVDDLGSEVTELHSLHITQFVDGVGGLYDMRVGGHESIHVGPNFQHLGIKCCGNYRSGIVASATSKVRYLVRLTVTGYESTQNADAWHLGKGIAHKPHG